MLGSAAPAAATILVSLVVDFAVWSYYSFFSFKAAEFVRTEMAIVIIDGDCINMRPIFFIIK